MSLESSLGNSARTKALNLELQRKWLAWYFYLRLEKCFDIKENSKKRILTEAESSHD